MKTLGKEARLQADSTTEIARDLDHAVTDMAGVHKFQGRKVKVGPFLNALAVWWLSLPPAQRDAVTAEALRALETRLQAGDPGAARTNHQHVPPTAPPARPAKAGHSVDPETGERVASATERRRKKSG